MPIPILATTDRAGRPLTALQCPTCDAMAGQVEYDPDQPKRCWYRCPNGHAYGHNIKKRKKRT